MELHERFERNPSLLILSLNTRENQFPLSVVGMGGKMQEIYFNLLTLLNFRLEIHLASLNNVGIYLVMIPLGVQDIEHLADSWETSMNSDRMPVLVLSTGTCPNLRKGSRTARLMVQEQQNAGYGMGILPLLETVNYLFGKLSGISANLT